MKSPLQIRAGTYRALAVQAISILRGRSYWHKTQGLGRAFRPGHIHGYFNDLTAKTEWGGPIDECGLPVTSFGRGGVAFPTTRFQKALGHWDRGLLREGDLDAHRAAFISLAEWAVEEQDRQGGWPVWPLAGWESATPYSAMTQGQALSVLVRADSSSRDPRFMQAADHAAGLLLTTVESGGVSRSGVSGLILEELPTCPPSTILNGWVFALFGLYDLHLAAPAPRLLAALDGAAAELASALPGFDAGYWSRYDARGALASPFYHQLHIAQMEALALAFPMHAATFGQFRDLFACQWSSRLNRSRAVAVKVVQKVRKPPPTVIR